MGEGAGELHRRTGHPESGFHFRTDRHPLDVASKNVHEETDSLVAAVVADAVAEEATTDADSNSPGTQDNTSEAGVSANKIDRSADSSRGNLN